MKLVTTLLLAATSSAFALNDGPIFECDREWYEGFMAISRRRDAEAVQRAVLRAHFDAENAQIAAQACR
jgi:hypothetical protein